MLNGTSMNVQESEVPLKKQKTGSLLHKTADLPVSKHKKTKNSNSSNKKCSKTIEKTPEHIKVNDSQTTDQVHNCSYNEYRYDKN